MVDNRGFLYFCLGCVVGGVGAILFAPKSGPETVDYLSRKANDGVDYVRERATDAQKVVTEAVTHGKRAARYQAENVRAAVDAGAKAYKEGKEATP
jgi:gas vesicle protein